MVSVSISNLDCLKIENEKERKIYYGCDQDWYKKEWQRLAGCGPSVACNLMLYLDAACDDKSTQKGCRPMEECLSLMEEMWGYVTPTMHGIPSARIFCDDLLSYARAKGLGVEYDFCEVPEDKTCRPKLEEILNFIEKALSNDIPVAFLNLCNGEEKKLDKWHWVTIVALEREESGESAFVDILDIGTITRIDIALWYNTTKLGGGFAYFSVNERPSEDSV